MALIKCPECKRKVSTDASVCPHCGFDVSAINVQETIDEQNKNAKSNMIVLLAVMIFIFAIIGSTLYLNYKDTSYTRAQKRFEDISGYN